MTSLGSDRGRFSIRTALIALIVVPLLGLGALASVWISYSTTQAERYTAIGQLSADVSGLVALQSALSVEKNWAAGVQALDDLGVTGDDMQRVSGVSAAREYERAQRDVDAALDQQPVPQVAERLISARASDAGAVASIDEYREVESAVSEQLDMVQSRLSITSGSVDAPAEMGRSVEVMAVAEVLRDTISPMAANLVGVVSPELAVTADPAKELLDASARYRNARTELNELVAADNHLLLELEQIDANPDVARFFDAVAAATDDIVAGESLVLAPDDENINQSAEAFLGSIDATDAYSGLLDSAADDLSRVSSDLEADAINRRNRVVFATLSTLVVSLSAAALIGRWIVSSLRGLDHVARRMNDGELDLEAEIAGPREVMETAAALNGAAQHLRHAEQQVLALATDDLSRAHDGPAIPGRLGNSLQQAFDRLGQTIDERTEFRTQLEHQATHDSLTKLSNRTAIVDRLAVALDRATTTGVTVAVLFVDLNEFKRINDQRGHAAGDAVLREVANRIAANSRATDLIGRLGGDEFVMVIDPVVSADQTFRLAQRIHRSIARPIRTDAGADSDNESNTVSLGASVGIAMSTGAGDTPESLLHQADLAVYRAKQTGGGIALCDDELIDEVGRRFQTEDALSDAIGNGQLVLHYQPIVDADAVPVAVEALVRWRLPDGSLRPPDDFIPIAEMSDLIVQLDRWAVREAALQLREWTDDPVLGQLHIAVNFSARHVSRGGFANEVSTILDEVRAPAERLVVEVTESALLYDLDHTRRELNQLRARGIRIAIDDFGTGYTSVGVLRELPIDILKLDRSFVEHATAGRDQVLAKLIIQLAHALGMQLIAEGIETDEQAALLTELGSDEFQGFLYCRPQPAVDVVAWIRSTVADAHAHPAQVAGR